MRRSLCFVIALVALPALADKDPNQTRGFSPENVYQLGDIDSVNVNNGNLIVRIPIGQAYKVGPALSYQFVLTHNGKIWDYEFGEGYRYSEPEKYSNAGFGWQLSLGHLRPPQGVVRPWTYIASDGGEYEFQSPLGAGDNEDPELAYAYNGTYLRMRRLSSGEREVDFPDGTIKTFDAFGRLKKIYDRHGNWVKVGYDNTTGSWTVTDGYGDTTSRTHTVHVRTLDPPAYSGANFNRRIDKIELAAISGTTAATATYDLKYAGEDASSPIGTPQWVGRGGGGERLGGSPSRCVTVPLLESITLPDAASFVASYKVATSEACNPDPPPPPPDNETFPADSGALLSLKLPTQGIIAWTQGTYVMNMPSCVAKTVEGATLGTFVADYTGVQERTFKDRNGNQIHKWTYHPRLIPSTDPAYTTHGCGSSPLTITDPAEIFVNVVKGPAGLWSKHYFSAYPQDAPLEDPEHTAVPDEHGLPINRHVSSSGSPSRALSTEIFDCSDGCSEDPYYGHPTTSPVRRTFVDYAREDLYHDGAPLPGTGGPFHPHQMTARRTELELGTTCSGGPCYVDVSYSEFDHYGHFKKTTTKSNFQGITDEITSYTGFTPVADATRWLLDIYSESWVKENGAAAKKIAEFDTDTGTLQSLRTLGASGEDPDDLATSDTDLLTVWCRASTAGERGFVTSERRVGGQDGGADQSLSTLCGRSATERPAMHYYIDHSYTFDTTASLTAHSASYSGSSLKTVDEEFFPATGALKLTKDMAGLETSYAYDPLGRLTEVRPPGEVGWTRYVYDRSAFPASVQVQLWPYDTTPTTSPHLHALKDDYYYYDDIGRLIQAKSRMPSDDETAKWATTVTKYVKGRVDSTSTPHERLTRFYESPESFSPTWKTSFAYDVFDRVRQTTAPDGTQTTTDYTGTRKRALRRGGVLRSTEEYDGRGRLVKVIEPSGPTSATITTGADVVTEYHYDFADRLRSVETTDGGVTQERKFEYDNRGFLTTEHHPEKGGTTVGNGTTYSLFDAAGRPWQRKDEGTAKPSIVTKFFYDESERLTGITDGAGNPIKTFEFAPSNDGTDYSMGKLRTAQRLNVLGAGTFRVTETYKYAEAGGRVSERETKVEQESGAGSFALIKTFTQTFEYDDDFGLPDKIIYPTCSGCSTSAGVSSVEQSFDRGALETIQYCTGTCSTLTDLATLSYHANGMLTKVQRSTVSESDEYTPDSGMPRPAQIRFSGPGTCVPPGYSEVEVSETVCPSSSASASIAEPVSDVTYSWEITGGSFAGAATGTNVTFTSGASGDVELIVTASNGCGSATPVSKTITIAGPEATLSGGATIEYGDSADLVVTLTGTPPWTVTWNDGHTDSGITASPATRAVSPAATTDYWVTDVTDDSCSGSANGTATVTVIPQPPAWVEARSNDLQVTVTWPPAAGAEQYSVLRSSSRSGPFQHRTTTSQLSYQETVPASAAPVTYVYLVLSRNASGYSRDAESPKDFATTASVLFADDFQPGITPVKASHIAELQKAIDAVRVATSGTLPRLFSNAPSLAGSPIRSSDLGAMINALDSARSFWNLPQFAYAQVPVPAVGALVYAQHIAQLREAVK